MLASMEAHYLFNTSINNGLVISQNYIDVNRSPFVKYCLKVWNSAEDFSELVSKVGEMNLCYKTYKVRYLDFNSKINFNERFPLEYSIGYQIIGKVDVHYPEISLGFTQVDGVWYFGEYLKNTGIWHNHDDKPRKYSNSLPSVAARAIVNIAAGDNINARLVDPCCGIGTVVLEALSMGVSIKGFDINKKVVCGAKENLRHFSYPIAIEWGDIHKLEGEYDAAILDMPYGIMSVTSNEAQVSLIKSAMKIANKVVIVSVRDIDEDIKLQGLSIEGACTIDKGNFKRYINVCTKLD